MSSDLRSEVQRLREGGFSPRQIRAYVEHQAQRLREGGFSEIQIQRWRGESPLDVEPFRKHFEETFRRARAENPEKEFGFAEAFEAGFERSVTGLMAKHRRLEKSGEKEPFIEVPAEDLGIAKNVALQTGTVLGDLPFMAGGFLVGAPVGGGAGSVVTGTASAFALPAALRELLIRKYERGEIQSVSEFWEAVTAAFTSAGKGYVTGAATAGAGAAAAPLGGIAKFGAEVVAMTSVGAGVEGEIPEPEDFVEAAILVGGLHVASGIAGRLRSIYAETGKHPTELAREAQSDPSIAEDLASKNIEVTRAQQNASPEAKAIEAARLEAELVEKAEFYRKVAPEGLIGFEETPLGRVLERISRGEENVVAGELSKGEALVQAWVDRLHPLDKIVSDMAEGKPLPVVEDAYKLMRMLPANASLAEHFLTIGPFRFGDRARFRGKSLRSILKPVRKEIDAFRGYLTARRVVELEGRDIAEAKISAEDARAVVETYGSRFETVARELYEFQDNVLTYFRDSGMLSSEQYDSMKALNDAFVPFYHVLEGRAGGPSTGRGLEPRQVIRRIRGNEEKLVDPLESVVKNTYALIEIAERNRVARSFVKLVETSERGSEFAVRAKAKKARPIQLSERERSELVRKVLDGEELTAAQEAKLAEDFTIFRRDALKPGKNQIAVYRDGKREVWDVDPRVYSVFENADVYQAGLLSKLFGAPARMLRAGSVLSPEFIGRNPFRDQLSAFLFSENGFRPYLDAASGVFHLLRKDAVYADWLRSGGPMASLVSLDRTYLQKNLRSILEDGGVYGAARNVVRNPIEMLRILSEGAEYATRIGVFERAQKKGVGIFEAGFESREATLDFNRAGLAARQVNQIVPFFNAFIRGRVKMVEAFRDYPVRTTARAMGAITLPSVILHLLNREEDWYKELEPWERDLFWNIKVGDIIWKIPKPFEMGIIFGTGAERIAEWILSEDPHAAEKLLSTLEIEILPPLVPSAAVPVVEAWANRSLFLNRPLIPERLLRLLPEAQYQPYTTELAKAVGQAVAGLPGMRHSRAASPALVENTIRAWTGGLGVHLLNVADYSLRKAGVLPDPVRPESVLADIPFIKGFVIRYPTAGAASIQQFFKRYREEDQLLATLNAYRRQGDFEGEQRVLEIMGGIPVDLKDVQQVLSEMAEVVRAIYVDPGTPSNEKRQAIDELYFQMIDVARYGNEVLDNVEKEREVVHEESRQ